MIGTSLWIVLNHRKYHAANNCKSVMLNILHASTTPSQREELATIIWAIWRTRNDKIWTGKEIQP
ncbi:hypothetical protein Fmac_013193 [Flemingia macrophylla]|uniref:Uncharacterized protein n=1 Tax=Flemingia macrophylla TaxID=520843 RepID=A0ABD1MTB8_9FABA